jgi:ankyrin repeat protein
MATPASQVIFPAVEAGDVDAVRKLLDDDAGLVHVRHADASKQQMTPLQIAAGKGFLEMCQLLVQRGAEVYTNPWGSYPPVIQAAWGKHAEVVKYFLEEIPDQAKGTNGVGVAINLAAREGWVDVVRKHIERDPLAVHQRGWIGDMPLHWPAHNNHAEVVSMLLDAGAEIEADAIWLYGGKPLHWASEHAPKTVRVLLDRGANVNSRNMNPDPEFRGRTPLIMNATQPNDCAEVTEMLLAAGADISAVDAKGKTAMAHAQEKGLVKIQEVLRRHGAS